jgi:hypothetical protein
MKNEQPSGSLKTIGRLEKIDLPEWDLFGLEAKIDTGAYTSSLHCHHIKCNEDKSIVLFELLDPSHEDYNGKIIKMPVHKIKQVKSSNGISEERIVIITRIILAGYKIKAQLSLADRTEMRYPLLVGRRLLKNRFLVDVNRKFDQK